MRRQQLTARGVAALKPEETRYDVFDTLTPGLSIRVSPSGHKSWSLMYRHQRRQRRLGLGRYPDRTLAEARDQALRERKRILDGVDPAQEKRDERATYGDTVGALHALYAKFNENKRSWPEQRRIFEREVLPVWRLVRVQDITRKDVRALVEAKAETAPTMANRMLARISRLLSFALERDWITANPAFRIRKPGEERSRDRVLSRDELRELWTALQETEATHADGTAKPRLSQTLNHMLIVMLLTAQRRGEVCTMQWQDVNLKAGWWMIPSQSSKNGDAH
jgi:hypothetical protein